jgi:hypothetical protein
MHGRPRGGQGSEAQPVDSAFLLAVISSATVVSGAVVTAGLTYFFTKRREREADWRKFKLDQYKEYVAALSGIVEGRDTPEGHIRYVDTINSLTLVASPEVLRALYAYMDHTTSRNANKTREPHDKILTGLMNALRHDVNPRRHREKNLQTYRLITVPPDMRSSRLSLQEK